MTHPTSQWWCHKNLQWRSAIKLDKHRDKGATLLRWTVSRLNDWKGKAPYNISKTYFGHPCKKKLTSGKQGVSETSFRHSFNVQKKSYKLYLRFLCIILSIISSSSSSSTLSNNLRCCVDVLTFFLFLIANIAHMKPPITDKVTTIPTIMYTTKKSTGWTKRWE